MDIEFKILKKMKQYYFLIILIIMASCSENEKDNFTLIEVKQGSKIDDLNINNLKIVPLEVTPKSIIATIAKIEFYADEYYVLDAQYNNLMVFDEKGSFKRNIGGTGRGPGEFTKARDFNIDRQAKTISIISNNEKKILNYDLQGNFFKDENLKVFGNMFAVSGDKKYVYINHNDNDLSEKNNILIFNSENEIIEKAYPFPETKNLIYTSSGFLGKFNDEILFNPALSDTIFRIDNQLEGDIKYVFDFGTNQLPTKVRVSSEKYMSESQNYQYLLKDFIEKDGFLIFSYSMDGFAKTGIAKIVDNKNTTKKIQSKTLNFPYCIPAGVHGNKILSYAYHYQLKDKKNKKAIDSLIMVNKNLSKIIGDEKQGDNPVLITYTVE